MSIFPTHSAENNLNHLEKSNFTFKLTVLCTSHLKFTINVQHLRIDIDLKTSIKRRNHMIHKKLIYSKTCVNTMSFLLNIRKHNTFPINYNFHRLFWYTSTEMLNWILSKSLLPFCIHIIRCFSGLGTKCICT